MPYDPKRLPLIEALENRDTSLNRDCKMVNSIGEQTISGTLHAIKRPGNVLAFQGVVGMGQGITNYLNSLYSISGDFLNSFSALAGLTATLATGSAAWQRRDNAAGVGFAGKLWIFGGRVDPLIATPTFSATVLAGQVNTITVTNAGLGYAPGFPSPITLSITGGGGSGATATATITGQQVSGVTITNGGSGYTSPPTVTASAVGWGIMNDVWSSVDGVNWSQVTASAAWGQRFAAAATVFNGAMYIAGGGTGQLGGFPQDKVYSDVWFSTDGLNWTQATANAWPGRYSPGIEVFNNKLWIAGGSTLSTSQTHDSKASFSDVYSSADGVNWVKAIDRAPWVARDSFGFFTANNLLWVIGGTLLDAFSNATTDSWSSPDGITWTRSSTNPFGVASSGVWPIAAFLSTGQDFTIPPPVTVNNSGTGGTGAAAYAFTDFDDDGDDEDLQAGPMVLVTFSAAGSGYNLAPALTFGTSVGINASAYAFLSGTSNDGRKSFRTGRIGSTVYLLEWGASTSGYVHRVWTTTDGVTYTLLSVNYAAGWPPRAGTWITYGNLWMLGGSDASVFYNDVWFITLGGTSTALTPDSPNGFFHFSQTSTSIATPLLVFKSTTDLYSYNASLNILTKLSNVANYPQTTVPGIVYLDGYFFVMDPQGRIWNSAVNDPGTWTALGVIAMQNEPNGGVAIAKLATYVVGFGVWTIEFFYDAAAPAPASPLLPNQTLPIQVGCAAGESVIEMEASVVWIGQTRREGKGVYIFNGYNPTRISTPFVDRILQADNLALVRAYSLDLFGHPHYVLYLAASSVCLVYDFSVQTWSTFTGTSAQGTKAVSSLSCDPYGTVTALCTAHGFSDGDPIVIAGATTIGYNGLVNINVIDNNTFTYYVGTALAANLGTATAQGYNVGPFNPVASAEVFGLDYVQDPTSGSIYAQTISAYDDHGNPIDFQVVTSRWDAGNSIWKFVARTSLVCDMVNSYALVAHSDDDYQTFGSYRFVNLTNSQRPTVPIGGRTRRRAFRIRHTAATPFRAEALELEFFFGSA